MKKKEKLSLAKRIGKYTLIVEQSDDKEEVRKAKEEILRLTSKIESLDDMLEIDVYIQDFLENNLK